MHIPVYMCFFFLLVIVCLVLHLVDLALFANLMYSSIVAVMFDCDHMHDSNIACHSDAQGCNSPSSICNYACILFPLGLLESIIHLY